MFIAEDLGGSSLHFKRERGLAAGEVIEQNFFFFNFVYPSVIEERFRES